MGEAQLEYSPQNKVLLAQDPFHPFLIIIIFLFDGKDEFIKTKQRNYKEVGLLLSTLIIDSKERVSKEPNTLYLRDHLAKGPSTRLPNTLVIQKKFSTMNFCTCNSVVHH